MRTTHVIIMLATIGGILAWQLRALFAENIWYGVPMLGLLILAGVFHHLQPGAAARRRALLFAVAIVASLASGVFVVFGYNFIRLLRSGPLSFDSVWSVSGVAAGVLAAWLWFRFARLLRQV